MIGCAFAALTGAATARTASAGGPSSRMTLSFKKMLEMTHQQRMQWAVEGVDIYNQVVFARYRGVPLFVTERITEGPVGSSPPSRLPIASSSLRPMTRGSHTVFSTRQLLQSQAADLAETAK